MSAPVLPASDEYVRAASIAAMHDPANDLSTAQFGLNVVVNPDAPVPAALRAVGGEIELVISEEVTATAIGAVIRALLADSDMLLYTEGEPCDFDFVVAESDGTVRGIGEFQGGES